MGDVRKNTAIPYGDEVKLYIDPNKKTAVPAWVDQKDYNKGWADVRVGEYTTKARGYDASGALHELLREHYPQNTIPKTFFDDLSYHSSMNKGTAGKVENYGVGSPYMVQFSRYTPVATYKLLYPVKTSAPGSSFGNQRSKVTSYDWEFIVLQWQPTDKGEPLRWRVEHKIRKADGSEDVLYESPWTDDPTEALERFNKRVTSVGGKAYTVPKSLGKVFEREYKRSDRVREGKLKIRRATGRKRSSRTTKPMDTSFGGLR